MFNVSSFKLITQRFSNRIDLYYASNDKRSIEYGHIGPSKFFYLFRVRKRKIFFLITDHLKSALAR